MIGGFTKDDSSPNKKSASKFREGPSARFQGEKAYERDEYSEKDASGIMSKPVDL